MSAVPSPLPAGDTGDRRTKIDRFTEPTSQATCDREKTNTSDVPKWRSVEAFLKIHKKFAFCSNRKNFFAEVIFLMWPFEWKNKTNW